jgi:hypothetical protein
VNFPLGNTERSLNPLSCHENVLRETSCLFLVSRRL